MKFVIDIDGTICSLPTDDNDYTKALPMEDRISHINSLYDSGHTIVYFTARGMGRTGGSASSAYDLFFSLTKDQLTAWGAKHHELILGKPAGDVYIDDKAVTDSNFFDVRSFE